MRRCQGCGQPLPLLARPDRLHCDARCRQAARRLRLRVLPSPPDLDQLAAALEPHGAEPVLGAGVTAAAADDWRAAAWLLSRRAPERRGRRSHGEEDDLDLELEEDTWM